MGIISFVIPSYGNKITKTDIKNNLLRITVDYKNYFPDKSCYINVNISDCLYNVWFGYRDKKSHVISLRKEAMTNLKIKEGDLIKITLKNNIYYMEKV